MPLSLIAAVARNGVIGHDNRLLWRLKSDLRRFRELTVGKPLVMGRKTFDSIGRPLPNRDNIVVTRDPGFTAEGVIVARSLEAALEIADSRARAHAVPDIMVGGGGEIYAQTIDRARRLYITEVDLAPEGDAVFPPIDPAQWKEMSRKAFPRGPDDEAAFTFIDYARR